MEEAILSDVRWPLSVLVLESKEQVDNRGPSLNAKVGVIETVLLDLPVSSDIESDWISDEVIDLALWFASNIFKNSKVEKVRTGELVFTYALVYAVWRNFDKVQEHQGKLLTKVFLWLPVVIK